MKTSILVPHDRYYNIGIEHHCMIDERFSVKQE